MAGWEKIKARTRVEVPIGDLSFDVENPRFTPEKSPENVSDDAIIGYLAATADLSELVQSISASGYIDIEPLIVIGRKNKLVVLEGNRRLAALRVLADKKFAALARIAFPESVVPAALPKKVAVYRVIDESEARDLIGFKHINGPKAWDAYAKARYAAKWLDIENAKARAPKLSLSDIAHRMGDKHDTIHRIVTAVYVLDQAQSARVFSVDDRVQKNFNFSHLYTALSYIEFREFLGMQAANKQAVLDRNLVPKNKLDSLGRLLRWLFGAKSENFLPAIKTQAPDLSRLKRVVGDPRSRRVMLERNNLDEAEESTISATDRFEKSLVDAESSLKSAQSSLDGYNVDDSALFDIAVSVKNKSNLIHSTMENIKKDSKKG
jgi:hypothetical protein